MLKSYLSFASTSCWSSSICFTSSFLQMTCQRCGCWFTVLSSGDLSKSNRMMGLISSVSVETLIWIWFSLISFRILAWWYHMWGLVLGWMWCFVCLICCLLKVLRALERARLIWLCPCWPPRQCDSWNVVFWCSLSDLKMELFVYLAVWRRNCLMSLPDVLWDDFQQRSLYVLNSDWKRGLTACLQSPAVSVSQYQVDSSLW